MPGVHGRRANFPSSSRCRPGEQVLPSQAGDKLCLRGVDAGLLIGFPRLRPIDQVGRAQVLVFIKTLRQSVDDSHLRKKERQTLLARRQDDRPLTVFRHIISQSEDHLDQRWIESLVFLDGAVQALLQQPDLRPVDVDGD